MKKLKTFLEKKHTQDSFAQAFADTFEVLLYTGAPATGVAAFLVLLEQDIPTVAKYSVYIASAINIAIFFAKRFYDYASKNKPLK